jgi:hypothetical protein
MVPLLTASVVYGAVLLLQVPPGHQGCHPGDAGSADQARGCGPEAVCPTAADNICQVPQRPGGWGLTVCYGWGKYIGRAGATAGQQLLLFEVVLLIDQVCSGAVKTGAGPAIVSAVAKQP